MLTAYENERFIRATSSETNNTKGFIELRLSDNKVVCVFLGERKFNLVSSIKLYHQFLYQPITVPLLGKCLFSYREGTRIDHHACSGRFGDVRLILIISPRFLTMFSFTDVSDVQDTLRKYIMH